MEWGNGRCDGDMPDFYTIGLVKVKVELAKT